MANAGVLFCLASAAGFGAMGIFGKLAYDEGATVGTLLSIRFVLAAAVLLAVRASARGEPSELRRPSARRRMCLALGAIGYGAPGRLLLRGARSHRRLAALAAPLHLPGDGHGRRHRARPRARAAGERPRPWRWRSAGSCSSRGRRGGRSIRWVRRSGSAPRVVYCTYILVSEGWRPGGALAMSRSCAPARRTTLTVARVRRSAICDPGAVSTRRMGLARCPRHALHRRRDRACSSPGCGGSARRRASILSTSNRWSRWRWRSSSSASPSAWPEGADAAGGRRDGAGLHVARGPEVVM